MSKRFVIIDGNSLINRAYYAMQRPMVTKDGIYTQGIYGFLNMLTKIMDDYGPEYMAVAWDMKAPTFRHKEYSEYKAGRKKMPVELAMELPIMKDILRAMSIECLEEEGFEADDIIGTMARIAEEAGMDPLIITGDKDALQLATDKTRILITRRGISEFDLFDREKMIERYQLTPEQFIDLKGLMGDSSDNIPGIPGVGEKTGIKLLLQFGSVAELLARTDEIQNAKLRQKVEDNAQLAAMSRRLATINKYVPLDVDFENFRIGETDYKELIDIYVKLEFNSFLKKLHIEEQSSFGNEEIEVENVLVDSEDGLRAIEGLKEKSSCVIKVFTDNNHIGRPEIWGASVLVEDRCFYVDCSRPELLNGMVEIMNRKSFKIIGHDLIRDYYGLMFCGYDNFSTEFDTAVAQYLIDPSRRDYLLKTLVFESLHYEIEDEKEFLNQFGQTDLLGNGNQKVMEYGSRWCVAVRRLVEIQKEKLENAQLNRVYREVELPLVRVLASMETEGFDVDRSTLIAFGEELKGEVGQIEQKIYQYSGKEFNIKSPVQLGEVLFDDLKLPAGKKTKRGYSTGAEVLEKIKDKHPIVEEILKYRTLTKLDSTYVEGLLPLIGFDGRIRAHFQQTVTTTGRISCTEPNLQNIPVRHQLGRQLRKAFVAGGPGKTLVGADYSQIELRIMAHLSGDRALIDAFNNGDDIHRATAARVFDLDYDSVTSLDRSKAKAVNFGVIYGMSGFGLSEELHISRKEAENYIAEYFEKHRAVKDYLDDQIAACHQRGYSETIMGRKRYIHEISSSNYMMKQLGERLAMNSPIQGSAADIIKIAMIKVYDELRSRKMKSRLILQVHDELIIRTDESELEDVKELLVRNMESAMDLKVVLESDLNQADTWYDLK